MTHLFTHHQPDPSITLMNRIIGFTRLSSIVWTRNSVLLSLGQSSSRSMTKLTMPGGLRVRVRRRPNRAVHRRDTYHRTSRISKVTLGFPYLRTKLTVTIVVAHPDPPGHWTEDIDPVHHQSGHGSESLVDATKSIASETRSDQTFPDTFETYEMESRSDEIVITTKWVDASVRHSALSYSNRTATDIVPSHSFRVPP